jgi:hypothetical protein
MVCSFSVLGPSVRTPPRAQTSLGKSARCPCQGERGLGPEELTSWKPQMDKGTGSHAGLLPLESVTCPTSIALPSRHLRTSQTWPTKSVSHSATRGLRQTKELLQHPPLDNQEFVNGASPYFAEFTNSPVPCRHTEGMRVAPTQLVTRWTMYDPADLI